MILCHINLSKDASERFETLKSLDLREATLLCLSDEFISKLSNDSDEEIFKKLIENYGATSSFLFSDSTTISSEEIAKRVKNGL